MQTTTPPYTTQGFVWKNNSHNLRPYQSDLKSLVYNEFLEHRAVCAVLPTGGGKTQVAASIIADGARKGRKTLFLAHRTELITQAHAKVESFGIPAGIIQANRPAEPWASVQVASVQTLARRQSDFMPNLIIIDEAHHATAETYRRIIDSNPFAKVLGITATPCRIGGKGLSDIFDCLALGPQCQDLVDAGYLVPARLVSMPLRESLEGVKSSAGDYNAKDLAAFLERTVLYGDIVSMYRQFAEGMRCLTFAGSVKLSKEYTNAYNAAGIPAAHIDGDTPDEERADVLRRLKSGALRVVCNVAIATEGLDIPEVEAVQIAVATKSLTKYLQMVGRAVRTSAGKTQAIVIDHGNNYERHGLPQEDRLWTIDGIKKRTHALQYETVAVDLPPVDNSRVSEIEHLTAYELRAIDPIDRELQRLMTLAEQRGYTNKKGKTDYHWAYRQWTESLDRKPTRDELKFIQRRAGYHHNWVDHVMKGGH